MRRSCLFSENVVPYETGSAWKDALAEIDEVKVLNRVLQLKRAAAAKGKTWYYDDESNTDEKDRRDISRLTNTKIPGDYFGTKVADPVLIRMHEPLYLL